MRECRRLAERETDVENGKMDGGVGGSSSDYIVHQATGRPASAHRIDV